MRIRNSQESKIKYMKKSKITRSQSGRLYLDQKALQEAKVASYELKLDFNNIPPDYAVNHLIIQELELRAIRNDKEICFDDYSVAVNVDYAVNKLTLIVEIKDKGLERLKKLGADEIRYNLTVCFPSKSGSSPLIRKETLNKINALTLS